MGVGLGEAAYGRVVVAGAEIIASCLGIQIFATVAEGVGIQFIRILLLVKPVAVTQVSIAMLWVRSRPRALST